MITKSQKEKLQEHLKKDWIPEVLEELKNNNIVSSRGTFYSESMVRMVFTGKINHKEIELIIFKVYKKRKLAFEAYEKEKDQILFIKYEEE
ncbi:hypothetical protein [Pontimicrobium sp. SW4]|uniref:Uncharacterized protein n=1 Tax=Pontimicrobium sp. SW4 TaxID=3153519 RepID=A0AAU7BPE6_9FLAO